MSDIIEDDDEDALYISFTMDTKMMRLNEETFVPSKISIRADVNPEEEMSESEITLALSKIRFFYENIVSKCIAFSYDNEHAIEILINEEGKNRTGNILMMTPGEPTDEMMATLFQAKMEALSDHKISFNLVEVKSDNPHGLSFVFVGDASRMLPDIESWIGKRSFFTQPWWNRDDASTLDVIPPPDADLTQKPAWAFSLNPIMGAKTDSTVILRPSFKPTVIEGGKPV
jgi:hypothetical protein